MPRPSFNNQLNFDTFYGFDFTNQPYGNADTHEPFFRLLVAGLKGYAWTGNAATDQKMASLYFGESTAARRGRSQRGAVREHWNARSSAFL